MKDRIISNNCRDCAYFVQHYAKLDGEYYAVTSCLHCNNPNLKLSEQKKRLNNLVICEYRWPKFEKQQRHENMKRTLKIISDLLKDISEILEEED